MSGGGSDGSRRRAAERARLTKLVRASLVVVAAALVSDAVGGRLSNGSPASDASAASADTSTASTTTTAPPVTLAPLPSIPGEAPVISRVETTDPVVFLTIDDGHTRTPEVLAAFDSLGVPATLFLLDGPVQAGADFFRAMPNTAVEGHTRNHPDLRTLSEQAQQAEICGNADTIERTFGRRPVLFRPPYGAYNDATKRAAAACGVTAVVMWEESVNGQVVSYASVPQLRPGDIVLMHFRPTFVEELRTISQQVEQAGLRFALLEDYLGVG